MILTIKNPNFLAVAAAGGGWRAINPTPSSYELDLNGSGPIGYALVCDRTVSGVQSISITAVRWTAATINALRSVLAASVVDCQAAPPTPPAPPAPPQVNWMTTVNGLSPTQSATVYYGLSAVALTANQPNVSTKLVQGTSGTATALYYDQSNRTGPVAMDRRPYNANRDAGLVFERSAATTMGSVGLSVMPPPATGMKRIWAVYANQFAGQNLGFFAGLGSGDTLPARVPVIPAALRQPNELHSVLILDSPTSGGTESRWYNVLVAGDRDLQLTMPSCGVTATREAGLLSASAVFSGPGQSQWLSLVGSQTLSNRGIGLTVVLEDGSKFAATDLTALSGWNNNWAFATGTVRATVSVSQSSAAYGATNNGSRDGDFSAGCNRSVSYP